jgi:serine/threonine protein kinase
MPKFPPRYKASGEVLEGGQGEVWICKDTYLERQVAIKFLKDVKDVETTTRELAAIREIRSKHVVQVFDLINPEGPDIGVVQEFLPGDEVTACTEGDGELDLDRYLKTLYQVASGISDIHDFDCVHRDIKPNNMKFGHENIIQIFDFGLSGFAKHNEETAKGRGTNIFRAPELYGKTAVKPTLDTYAFGATAWFLADKLPKVLTEHPPQKSARVPSLDHVLFGCEKSLIELLDSCLSVNPKDRPEMRLVANALKRQLLKGKHRARFSPEKVISKVGQSTKLTGAFGEITVRYDGFDFIVQAATAEVSINGMPAAVGQMLPLSCVITIGLPERGAQRDFAPFEISHPEVVL